MRTKQRNYCIYENLFSPQKRKKKSQNMLKNQ